MAENQTSNEFRSLAVSPAGAAVLVGIGRTKLYQAMNAGVLPSFKIGARRLVRVAEIEAWLQRLESAARPRRERLNATTQSPPTLPKNPD